MADFAGRSVLVTGASGASMIGWASPADGGPTCR